MTVFNWVSWNVDDPRAPQNDQMRNVLGRVAVTSHCQRKPPLCIWRHSSLSRSNHPMPPSLKVFCILLHLFSSARNVKNYGPLSESTWSANQCSEVNDWVCQLALVNPRRSLRDLQIQSRVSRHRRRNGHSNPIFSSSQPSLQPLRPQTRSATRSSLSSPNRLFMVNPYRSLLVRINSCAADPCSR